MSTTPAIGNQRGTLRAADALFVAATLAKSGRSRAISQTLRDTLGLIVFAVMDLRASDRPDVRMRRAGVREVQMRTWRWAVQWLAAFAALCWMCKRGRAVMDATEQGLRTTSRCIQRASENRLWTRTPPADSPTSANAFVWKTLSNYGSNCVPR